MVNGWKRTPDIAPNEPILTKRQEKKNTTRVSKSVNFFSLIIFFQFLTGGILEPLYPY